MKFNCDYFKDKGRKKREALWEKRSQWHEAFAWKPIRLAHNDCRWLETVERRLKLHDNNFARTDVVIKNTSHFFLRSYEYRAKEPV